MSNPLSISETLTKTEQDKLRKVVTGYGKMTWASKESKVDRMTLYKAMAGMNVRATTAARIREFLKRH